MSKKEFVKKNLCDKPAETSPEQPTLKTVCNEWIERKKSICILNTIKSYQSKLKLYLFKAPFVDKPIDSIHREDIKQWVSILRETCAVECIYGTLGVMNNIFNYAIKFGWTKNNPPGMIKLAKPKAKFPEPFIRDEVETIRKNIDPFYHDYQAVMFFTGMRITEINALRPSDIDLKNKIIWIGRSSIDGKSHNRRKFRTHFMNERVFKAVSR